MENNIREKVVKLLEFLHYGKPVEKSDAILGLGSIDYKIAEKCASLYKQGMGEYIIFTGNCGKGTVGIIKNTEAENFRDIAVKMGVPEDKIYLEKNATTTFENYAYVKDLIEEKNLKADSLIVVQKPYAERRSKAIAEKFLKDKKVYITSPDFENEKFDEYYLSNKYTNIDEIINEIVAEIDINDKAPKYNIQSYQEIPKDVRDTFKELVDLGFNKYLVKEERLQGFEEKLKEYINGGK